MRFVLVFCGIILYTLVFSQKFDSLFSVAKSAQYSDSIRFEAIYDFLRKSNAYDSFYRSMIILGDSLIKKSDLDPTRIGRFYMAKSVYLIGTDRYDSAERLVLEAFDMFKKAKDTLGMAMSYGNLGYSYYQRGDFAKALDYMLKAQMFIYKLKDTHLITVGENNIASVYFDSGDTLNALKGYGKALKLAEQTGDYNMIALTSGNLGSVYYLLKQLDSSEYFFRKAIKFAKKNSYVRILGDAYHNLANLYLYKNNLDSAYKFITLALVNFQNADILSGQVRAYLDLSRYYLKKNKADSAKYYWEKAFALAKRINTKLIYKELYQQAYKLDSFKKDYFSALKNYQLYIFYKDSLSDVEVRRQIANLKSLYELKLKEQENRALKEREFRQRMYIKRQKTMLFMIVGFIILLLIFSILLFRSNRIIRKINKELTLKNKQITKQHQLLVRHQRDLQDSINFAADLQKAMLPDLNLLFDYFSDWFIFYLPRDVVSGDFYWIKKLTDNKILVLVGDCTGHGIPGALLSVLTIALLNETFSARQDLTAAQALDLGRKKIKRSLRQNSTDLYNHGLDIALIIYDKSQMKVNFAGAFRPLYIFRSGTLEIFKGDRQPVAAYALETPFTDYFTELAPGDMIYLFTDGFPDLYSSENKKFTVTRFKKLLYDIHRLPAREQYVSLQKVMAQWKGEAQQIDDILVLGLRV